MIDGKAIKSTDAIKSIEKIMNIVTAYTNTGISFDIVELDLCLSACKNLSISFLVTFCIGLNIKLYALQAFIVCIFADICSFCFFTFF